MLFVMMSVNLWRRSFKPDTYLLFKTQIYHLQLNFELNLEHHHNIIAKSAYRLESGANTSHKISFGDCQTSSCARARAKKCLIEAAGVTLEACKVNVLALHPRSQQAPSGIENRTAARVSFAWTRRVID
jgi:hypothetical protein